MVLYFSGTGNSQFAALQIAALLEDEAVSINQSMKRGERAAFRSERPLVFVAPTYSWRLPKVVERWILNQEFVGSRDAYFILTCGGGCGNAGAYAKKLCAKKGMRFCGLSPLLMPENYLALFPTPSEAECLELMEKAKPRIASLAKQVQAGIHFAKASVSLVGKLQSGPVHPLFYAFVVHDKGFRVTDGCVSCGRCVKRCPLNNLDMVDGKPRWKGDCTHCMACIAGCPTEAIEYKSKSIGRHRHYVMDDAKCWDGREGG